MSLSRRELLIGTSCIAASAALLPISTVLAQSAAASPLPFIDARETRSFRLEAIASETEFLSGAPSRTFGFNQSYLGPVLRLRSGTAVQAEITNRSERLMSVHWHGLLIPGEVDGGPHNPIEPGETWTPILDIDQGPATLWYHSHIHGQTAESVYLGLAGVLIVDDGMDPARGLPNDLGVDDLVLVLQDKRFNAAGAAIYEPTLADALHGFLGDTSLVNGQVEPAIAVPRGIVRLRLLNAANARNFTLFMSDHRPFHLLATDQGMLPEPVELSEVRLTPGERLELLVDFGTAGGRLMSMPHDEGVGATGMAHEMGDMPMQDDPFTAPFTMAVFETDSSLPASIRSVPPRILFLASLPEPSEPIATRQIILNDMGNIDGEGAPGINIGAMPGMNMGAMPGMNMGAMPGMNMTPAPDADGDEIAAVRFGINGKPFDMERIDHDALVGSTERWIIGGQMMGHPFHIHGARFKVVSEAGNPPRPENSGWKDTVFASGEIELLATFPHRAPADKPFMFHCHVLEHEDRGMMGQFTVSDGVPRAFVFGLTGPAIRSGSLVHFSVQLLDTTTGARVADAAIRVLDFNMEPEGMAGSNTVILLPVVEPGVQPMEVRPDMSGRWALVLEATIPNEPTVTATIIVRVPD